jgi:hypothetical protein
MKECKEQELAPGRVISIALKYGNRFERDMAEVKTPDAHSFLYVKITAKRRLVNASGESADIGR